MGEVIYKTLIAIYFVQRHIETNTFTLDIVIRSAIIYRVSTLSSYKIGSIDSL